MTVFDFVAFAFDRVVLRTVNQLYACSLTGWLVYCTGAEEVLMCFGSLGDPVQFMGPSDLRPKQLFLLCWVCFLNWSIASDCVTSCVHDFSLWWLCLTGMSGVLTTQRGFTGGNGMHHHHWLHSGTSRFTPLSVWSKLVSKGELNRSIMSTISSSGIRNRCISSFSLNLSSCLLKLNVWHSWKHDCECCFFCA